MYRLFSMRLPVQRPTQRDSIQPAARIRIANRKSRAPCTIITVSAGKAAFTIVGKSAAEGSVVGRTIGSAKSILTFEYIGSTENYSNA